MTYQDTQMLYHINVLETFNRDSNWESSIPWLTLFGAPGIHAFWHFISVKCYNAIIKPLDSMYNSNFTRDKAMRGSWIPALSHFVLNARTFLFAGTSERTENGKTEGMVPCCLFNVQGSTSDTTLTRWPSGFTVMHICQWCWWSQRRRGLAEIS